MANNEMSFDFTQPSRTVVEKSLKGKTFFIYGTNRTGKTANAVKFPKPFAVAFENGLNAIAGQAFVKPSKWGDTKKIVKQFRRPEVKEMYDTIILDTADKMASLLIKRICSDHDVDSIGEANNGFGAYGDISKLLGEFLDALTDEGYTVVIIGHDATKQVLDPLSNKKYEKMVPRGDKRVIEAICDMVDIIGCCQPNGFDENGDEILSSIYFKDGKFYKAGSRWQKIVPSTTFTVPNIEKAMIDAINAEEADAVAEGNGEFFVDHVEKDDTVKLTFEELQGKVKEAMVKDKEVTGNYTFSLATIAELLGEGVKVSDATHRQYEVVEEILETIVEHNKAVESGEISLD